MPDPADPHRDQPVRHVGAPLELASLAMIMVHGRGSDGADMMGLAEHFFREEVAYLAPEAFGHAWYPNRFTAPVAQNEPYLSSALGLIAGMIDKLGEQDIAPSQIILLGFSQGACLASEFVARNPRRYAGLAVLSGGLIGETPGRALYAPGLDGTPVFLGCSDVDAHIPVGRVRESSLILRELGAEVTERIYPGMGHTVNDDEIAAVNAMLDQALAAGWDA